MFLLILNAKRKKKTQKTQGMKQLGLPSPFPSSYLSHKLIITAFWETASPELKAAMFLALRKL